MESYKTYCHKCQNDTKQTREYFSEEYDTREIFFESLKGEARYVVEVRKWSLTKCLGCESLNLSIETTHVGNKNSHKKNIPGRPKKNVPTWIFGLKREYIELLSEIYSAYNHGNLRLTSMGIRTMLDVLMTDSIGDIGSFSKKISEFKSQGFINSKQADLITTCIEAGSASSHRSYKPDDNSLRDLLDIIEHLVETDILVKKSQVIKSQIPKRNSSA